MNKFVFFLFVSGMFILASCDNDDDMEKTINEFTLTIENVSTAKMYFDGGATEGIPPGGSFTFSFNAGKGHYLSFATMLAQSNDLFFGFSGMGLALFDESGMAMTGNVTDMVYLWDAGTEVNEEPGVGENQAPRQSTANTGMDENMGIMKIDDVNDGFTYPDISNLIEVMIEHDGGTKFTVTIKNKSDMVSLTGPLAPGAWAVHGTDHMLFTMNSNAPESLEKLAEDGNNEDFKNYVMSNSGFATPFAPGVYAVYSGDNPIFKSGMAASSALEALAEDGDPSGFDFNAQNSVMSWGAFNTPVSATAAAPIFPGEKYMVQFSASEGEYLSFATMLVQSNDLFAAPMGISLYTNGEPMSGDITSKVKLWDAYTEMNEYPGAGMNQPPRQAGPNTGTTETGTVMEVNDGFTYPMVSDMIKVTLSYK